jgi:predicted Zn-dependent protease with MMP-like domain
MEPDFHRLQGIAGSEVEGILKSLPAPLREKARELPVTLERCPSADLVADGIQPDTLGLFVGPEFGEGDASMSPLPPQIILYLENLWEMAEEDEDVFRFEVRTTYLHELGHYLGLDEDDLFERGLD